MPRYADLSLNSGQYVQQYQGIPLDEIRRTADVLSGRHYQNLAQLSQLQLLGEQYKSKVTEGARPYFDTQLQGIDSALREIASKGGEHATARVAALSNKFLGDQGVLKSLQIAEALQKEREDIAAIVRAGGTPIRKKGQMEAAEKASVYGEDNELTQFYRTPYTPSVTKYLDPKEDMKAIWSELTPESREGIIKAMPNSTLKELLGHAATGTVADDIPLFFESITKTGISHPRVMENLKNAYEIYKGTDAYKQAIEYAGDTPEERADEEAKQFDKFLKYGILQEYESISRQPLANQMVDDIARAAAKNKQHESTSTYAPGEFFKVPVNYNSNGYPKSINEHDFKEYSVGGGVGGWKSASHKKEERERSDQYLQDLETAKEAFGVGPDINIRPGFTDITPLEFQQSGFGPRKEIKPGSPEATALVNKYLQAIEETVVNVPLSQFTKDDALIVDDNIKRSIHLVNFLDEDTGKIFRASDPEFMQYTDGDLNNMKVESKYSPLNIFNTKPEIREHGDAFVSPYAINVKDPNGKPKRLIVGMKPEHTSQYDINRNVLYRTAMLRPGQSQQLPNGMKIKRLLGDQPQKTSDPRTKFVLSVDGKELEFVTIETMASFLLDPAAHDHPEIPPQALKIN